ncbi:UNVERIFIED_CONTAM: hypothetical protein FKN15_006796 [Acipenser sinensis]
MKLEAVVVTVALAEEEEYLSALAKQVHITALQSHLGMSRKCNVSWVKPTEPAFLKKFKNDVGYKEGPTVDTKRQDMPVVEDSGDSDREDELPQVVVLKKGDLSAEEVMKIKTDTDGSSKEGKKPPMLSTSSPVPVSKDDASADGKIMFRKPVKRSSDNKFQRITATSSKKKKGNEKKDSDDSKTATENLQKKVKNSSLLSFGDDEEED